MASSMTFRGLSAISKKLIMVTISNSSSEKGRSCALPKMNSALSPYFCRAISSFSLEESTPVKKHHFSRKIEDYCQCRILHQGSFSGQRNYQIQTSSFCRAKT